MTSGPQSHPVPGTSAGPGSGAARVEHLTKVYGRGEAQVVALDDVTVAFESGRLTAIMGPSGSGKSTLMHCAAGLDSASAGDVWIGDTCLTGLGDDDLTRLRRTRSGSCSRRSTWSRRSPPGEHHPADGHRRASPRRGVVRQGRRRGRAHRPARPQAGRASGGQQQRVACARALAAGRRIVFADEPTGNLDSHSAGEVLGCCASVDGLGQTVVMVTHDPRARP